MGTQLQGKVPSFRGAEYTDDDELQDWRATFLETFFAECPQAFEELKGPIHNELQILKAKPRLAKLDNDYHASQLAEYEVKERKIALAIFTCFRPDSSGGMRHQISAADLRLCEEDHLPDLMEFRDAFLKWLAKYNLDKCTWVQDALLDSLSDLDEFPSLFKHGYHADRNSGGWVVTSKPFQFEFRGFGLNLEYLEDYKTQIEAKFRAQWAEHVAAIEKLAEERGLKKAKPKDAIHHVWLVRHICLGKPFSSFRAKGRREPHPDRVRKAVVRLAKELEIDVPKGRRGRPPENNQAK